MINILGPSLANFRDFGRLSGWPQNIPKCCA